MKATELRKAIRAHRGPVYTPLIGVDDLHWVQCVKADLLHAIQHLADGELAADARDGGLYVSANR